MSQTLPEGDANWTNLTAFVTGLLGVAGSIFTWFRTRKTERIVHEQSNVDVLRDVMEELREEIKRLKSDLEEERQAHALTRNRVRELEREVAQLQQWKQGEPGDAFRGF